MVALRADPARHGIVAAADPSWLIDAASARDNGVARSGHLPDGARRRAHPGRSHRLAPSPQPLRMGVARIWVGPDCSASGAYLRGLRARGGARFTCGPAGHCPRVWIGESGGVRARALPVATVPHRPAAIATLASAGLDLGPLGGDDRGPRLPLR